MQAGRSEAKPLHVCPECESTLVHPVDWELVGGGDRWRCWRRCPECEWRGESVHGEDEVDAYDEALHYGYETLELNLGDWQRECIREMTPAFSLALSTDLITADDFR